MGKDGVAGAVLDPQMGVRGISGLRVCDASILPKLVSGHTLSLLQQKNWRISSRPSTN
ncbi:hypothetical protein BKA82DRAFT_4075943, partial [Pisolithus tinctorius]